MGACPKCGEHAPGRARFCPSCGAQLPAESSPPQDLRKVVTVLFCDLTGATSLAERLEAETLRRVLGRYFAGMRAILERHGGVVEKFIGDAIMAVFGVPFAREDDALRAVRAAVEMRAALREINEELEARWNVRLRVRTGVNTGRVVVAAGGRTHSFVIGDPVNVAARLEQVAEPDQILIGEPTYRLVRDAVRVEPVQPLALKGKAGPVPGYALLAVEPGAQAIRRRMDQPLVGREHEMARLRAALEDTVADRRCTFVSVLGPAGIGKSRLTAEFLAHAGREATVLRGRCLPPGEGSTFWPLVEVVEEAAAVSDRDSSETVREKLGRLLVDDDDREPVVDCIADVMGLGRSGAQPSQIFWALRRVLEARARERPVVVVFDDIHWGEPTFLDLVEHLASAAGTVAILVVAVARTELRELRPALAELRTAVRLGPLSRSETRALLENLLGGEQLDDDVVDRVFAAGDGTPLFTEELLRLLVEDGHLVRANGVWRAAGDLSVLSTPPTIQALIAARLDRLPRRERAVLQRAAVVGKVFWADAVRELTPRDERDAVNGHLEALVAKELVTADGPRLGGGRGVSFSHVFVRDVAYDGILKGVRADLHARTAAWIERAAGERAVEYDEIIGYHLESAHRYLTEVEPGDARASDLAARAAERLASAGTRALARCDMPAAVALLERASSLLSEDDPAHRDLDVKLSIAFAGTGQVTRVDQILSERIAAERTGRPHLVCHEPTGGQRTFLLDDAAPAEMTIGRRPDNAIALVWDSQVSREHAELRREGERWILVDDGTSRNGSFINGRRVTGRHPLSDGDVLRFGDTVMLYRAPRESARRRPAHAQPDGATVLGDSGLEPADLSSTERSVLRELRRSWSQPGECAAAPTDAEIAQRVSRSPEEVKEAIASLELKFSVEGLSESERRKPLAVRSPRTGE
jgi:class 3 adenylate cyclase